MIDYRVISIGSLSQNPFWSEPPGGRTAHATTTLIRREDRVIVVDPSLPGQVLGARLAERAGIGPEAVTDVFLTCFRPAHRRGLGLFEKAKWWISEAEREQVGRHLIGEYEKAGDEELRDALKGEIAIMQRTAAAPDALVEQVDLFPLPGYTPGTCGLLLSLPSATVVVAGDAVASQEHLEHGRVLEGGFDIEQARASLAEVIEIADWIIPGHDNIVPNMTRRIF